MNTKLTLTAAILLALGMGVAQAQDADPTGWKSGSGEPDLTIQADETDTMSEGDMTATDSMSEAEPGAHMSKDGIAAEGENFDADLVEEDDIAASEPEMGDDADPEPFNSKSDIGNYEGEVNSDLTIEAED